MNHNYQNIHICAYICNLLNIGLKLDNERYKDNIEKSNDNDTIRKFVVSYVKKLYNKTKLYLSNLIEII